MNYCTRIVVSVFAHVAVFIILVSASLVVHAMRLLRGILGIREGLRKPGELQLLLTGTFYNENWFRAHILPLSRTTALERIHVITDKPLFDVDKVAYVCPPSWAMRVPGRSVWRAVLVLWTALRVRPDYLMGYHIMPNAILCLLAASLSGGQSVYQMTGGPIQIIGGGVGSENALLSLLGRQSPLLERCLYHVVRQFSVIAVRGKTAHTFLSQHHLSKRSVIVTGSIDTERFCPEESASQYDLICVSRLTSGKGIEYLMRVMKCLREARSAVRIAILGDGNLRSMLADTAEKFGIADNIEFLGERVDVVPFLRRSRLFVLTSPSEGMSIAMLEAMAVGLPAMVTKVGELQDAVTEGVSGEFLQGDDPIAAASALARLLGDPQRCCEMSRAARRVIVEQYSIDAISRRWETYLSGFDGNCVASTVPISS